LKRVAANDPPKRSLADDPDFRARLAELDRGMSDKAQRPNSDPHLSDLDRDMGLEAPGAGSAPPPQATAKPRPAARTEPVPNAPPFPAVFPIAPPASHTAPQGTRRPLVDLFPSPHVSAAQPPAPPVPPAGHFASSAPCVEDPSDYEMFYGLHERPFSLSTDPRFFYHSTAHDHVAQAMLGAIGRREGMVLMTGDPGLGKTTLCRAVVEQLDRRTLTSLVADRFESTDDLLKNVLAEFGVISHDDIARGVLTSASGADLAAALHGFLVSLAALQAFAVVILDDAHDLPIGVLDQIRVLAESIGDEPALQIVLVGQPALDKMLGRAELRALSRRVSTRCRLKPIAADEVSGYIAHRLGVAGTSPRVAFDQTAAARVHELSGGVPTVINLLCDRTLEAGFNISASLLDDQLVKTAAEDLHLSPPQSRLSWAQKAAIAAALLVLVLLGAAAAAFVFRSELSALVSKWKSTPSSSSRPQPEAPPPMGPAAPPR
jgi:type II secretory pathway predicted ATPase ExeA